MNVDDHECPFEDMVMPYDEKLLGVRNWLSVAIHRSRAITVGAFSNEGTLLYANPGMHDLLQLDSETFDPSFFRSPSFSFLLSYGPSAEPVYTGLMTLNAGKETRNSILGSVFRSRQGLRVIGEFDIPELSASIDQMHDLNREVTKLHRESTQQKRQLQQTLEALRLSQAKQEKLQKDLLSTSRRAGRAEVAVSVLHNLGNALNSVSVSASLLSDKIRSARVDAICKVVDLLESNAHDLPTFISSEKGQQILPYLRSYAQQMAVDQDTLMDESSVLKNRLLRLKQSVEEHEKYGKTTTVMNSVDLARAVKESWASIASQHESSGTDLLKGDLRPCYVVTDEFRFFDLLRGLVEAAVVLSRKTTLARVTVATANEPELALIIRIDGLSLSKEEALKLILPSAEPSGEVNLHAAANAATELDARLSVEADAIVARFLQTPNSNE